MTEGRRRMFDLLQTLIYCCMITGCDRVLVRTNTAAASFLIHPNQIPLSVFVAVLLDPPANVTVSSTGQQGQLSVSWVPPSLKYMDDSMMYEVSYAAADSHMGKVWTFFQELTGASVAE